jgi:preprotein translocase subunit YajC
VGALLLIAITFGLMYVLIILPQQRRVRAHQAVVSSLAVGDEVMTTAGMYGRLISLDGDTVQLEIAPGIVVKLARGAIANRVTAGSDDSPSDSDGDATADDAPASGDESPPATKDDPPPTGARVIQPRRGLVRRRPGEAAPPPGAADA